MLFPPEIVRAAISLEGMGLKQFNKNTLNDLKEVIADK